MKSKLIILVALGLLILSCSNGQPSHKGSGWKVIGPGGGGGVFLPTISPFDENLVLASCDMTGAYVSRNGGMDWRMMNLWTVLRDFEFDPKDPNTIYAATRGYLHDDDRGSGLSILYRSNDKGQNWEIVYPDPMKTKKFENFQSSTLRPSDLMEGLIDGTIDKIKIDPENNQRIYLGLSPLTPYLPGKDYPVADSSWLILSENRSKTWRKLAALPVKKILGIFPGSLAGRKDEVLIFTESSCLRLDERAGRMTNVQLPSKIITDAESGRNGNGTTFYILSSLQQSGNKINGGVFKSTDWGKSWKPVNMGLPAKVSTGKLPQFWTIAVCEKKPEIAYLSVLIPAEGPNRKADTKYMIYKTETAGDKWFPVYNANSIEVLSKNFKGSWMERSYDPGWGGNPIHMGVAPSNPEICYATDYGRAHRTTDGGKTWEQVYSHNHPDGSVTSSGLDVTCSFGIYFDPFDKNHFIISNVDVGIFDSYDKGKTWTHSIDGIPAEWVNTCYSIAFDPQVKGKVWSVWSSKHSLPRKSQFDYGGFGNYVGGVVVSENGGKKWTKSNKGIPENSVCTHILMDSVSPVDSRVLYVSVFDKGVYKSTDGGQTWNDASNGLGENKYAWQTRLAGNKLYLLCTRGWRDGKELDGALYYSDNEATRWKEIALPKGVNAPSDLLIDSKDTRKMYLSCWPRLVDGQDKFGGVYRTEDGGETWKQVFDEKMRVFAAANDPVRPGTIYINTFQNAAFRSDDYGNTWQRLKGYRFKWGNCPIPDPNNPDMLFLTTYGGGLFYGPSTGVPDASEEIENIPQGWW